MPVKLFKEKSEFDQICHEKSGKLVVVDCFASWCGPCKVISPKFEAMENEFSGVVFLKVDVDEAEEFAADQKIKAMPTFLFFKDGSKIDELVGANEGELRKLIRKHM